MPRDRCARLEHRRPWTALGRGGSSHLLIPFLTLAFIAVLFVGWEVVERRLFPTRSIGFSHFFLTLRALVITALACGMVYLLMYRQQRRLSMTAEQVAGLLETYMADPNTLARFENPHLLHCREAVDCGDPDCPMYDSPGGRCWQVMALGSGGDGDALPSMEIEKCHECATFRRSCPDKLVQLGETCNNLLFLLKVEARRMERMRSQMVEREKIFSIGQLASGVAHEVVNPLSSISSIVQMLKRSGATADTDEQLALIETHIQRITGTLRQLEGLARRGDEGWAVIDVSQALEETVLLLSFDPRARNVDVHLEPLPPLPTTHGIPGQLQQVFINLSLNALDAMPDGGALTLGAQNTRGGLAIQIKDTGCGVPSGAGRRIFDPFFTTKEPGCGTGLGLAVSNSIVQKLNGTIEYQSTEGVGTVFTVVLPILSERPRALS